MTSQTAVSSEVALFDFLEDVTGLFPWKWIRRVDNGVKSLNIFSLSVFLFRCPRCSIALTVSPPPSPTPQLWRFPRRRRRRRWEHGNLTHPLVLIFFYCYYQLKKADVVSYSFVNTFVTHAVRYILVLPGILIISASPAYVSSLLVSLCFYFVVDLFCTL